MAIKDYHFQEIKDRLKGIGLNARCLQDEYIAVLKQRDHALKELVGLHMWIKKRKEFIGETAVREGRELNLVDEVLVKGIQVYEAIFQTKILTNDQP